MDNLYIMFLNYIITILACRMDELGRQKYSLATEAPWIRRPCGLILAYLSKISSHAGNAQNQVKITEKGEHSLHYKLKIAFGVSA